MLQGGINLASRRQDYQQQRQTRGFRGGCLSYILFAIIVLALVAGAGYFAGRTYLNQFKTDTQIPPVEMPQVDTSQRETIGVQVGRDTFNRLARQTINQALGDQINLEWVEDQLRFTLQVEEAGYTIPVEMLADMQVGDHEQPVIVFESMNTANLPIPLPMTEIYDIMTSQIALPEGMSYDPQEPKIHINLNQLEIPLIEDEVLLTALETDLASGFINIGVHFTPELLNLLLGGL